MAKKAKEKNLPENIYFDEGAEELLEEDVIKPEESAFMEGYDEGDKVLRCAVCKRLVDPDNALEEDFEGETVRFCSQQCAEKFEKEHSGKE